MKVLDINKTICNSIAKSGGTEEDLNIWSQTWEDLNKYCDIVPGISDDYTKDVILCWAGWVLDCEPDTVDKIYASCSGFNLSFKDDDFGKLGSKLMYQSLDKKVSDPVSVYRELAKDQLDRFREQYNNKQNAIVKAS